MGHDASRALLCSVKRKTQSCGDFVIVQVVTRTALGACCRTFARHAFALPS